MVREKHEVWMCGMQDGSASLHFQVVQLCIAHMECQTNHISIFSTLLNAQAIHLNTTWKG